MELLTINNEIAIINNSAISPQGEGLVGLDGSMISDGENLLNAAVSPTPTGETWVLNNELEEIVIEFNINFMSNEQYFSLFNMPTSKPPYYSLYYDTTRVYDSSSPGDEWYVGQAYRTVTFLEPPTGDLLTWLQANAVKQ